MNHLELPKVLKSELISIFESCQLVYLSVILYEVKNGMVLYDDRNLKDLGKFVPKTLKRIHFKLFVSETSFKESLRSFLEGYTNINSNGALKYLELGYNRWCDSIVTKQSGVQITVYYNSSHELKQSLETSI